MILAFCQAVGLIARRFGQPQVVAEMLAGVLLDPSLFGLLWPQGFAWLFPKESMKVLFPVSQLGLATYMFVVGLEFRMDIVSRRLRTAVAVSVAGMVTPFILGAGLGWFFSSHEIVPGENLADGGDDFSRRLHVHHGLSNAGASFTLRNSRAPRWERSR